MIEIKEQAERYEKPMLKVTGFHVEDVLTDSSLVTSSEWNTPIG